MLQYNPLQPFKIAFGYNVITCYFWVMGLPDYSFNDGVNPPVSPDELLNTVSNSYIRVLRTPKHLLKEYFPVNRKLHLTKMYTTLMFILSRPNGTIGYICSETGSNDDTIDGYVKELLRLNYIICKPRRTFIIPFNAYKLDKTYIITAKGKSVLHKLINY